MPFSNAFPMVYFSYCGESTPKETKRLSGRAVSLLHLNGESLGYRQYKKPQKTPPPISCAENKCISSSIAMCLRYMHSFKPITFQELRSYLTSNSYISFRFHFMHTPQHRTASGNTHFHFASSFIPFSPSPFPTHFQRYIFISATS
jgi:hypothetical protein